MTFVGLPLPAEAVDCTVPISGSMTISSSCTFPGTTNGVDAGTGTTNSAAITVSSGTLTIGGTQTISTGTLVPSGSGSITIVSGGAIKVGQPLWVYDADGDGYPKFSTMSASMTQELGWRRRNLMTSMTQMDCTDFNSGGYGCAPVSSNMTGGDHSGMYQEESGGPALGYRELPADNSTVGLWHMNEASGTSVADSSGNANTGTATGTTVVTGKLGNARSFNGTSDNISITDSASLNNLKALTIESWIYPTTKASGEWTILSKGNPNNSQFQYNLRLDSTRKIHFIVSTNGTSWGGNVTGNTVLSLNQWYHIVGVWDGSSVYVYLNGVSDATPGSLTGTIPSYSNAALIGVQLAGQYFAGTIDEIRISNIARTPEEIKANAQRKPYGIYTAPVDDLTQTPGSWTQLTVNAKGLKSGDGETPLSTSSLVAQWNFNDTPSTTTAVSGGTCGASCNGTLTNFSNTTAYDAVAGTGWTSANRRWGAGALMFDGTNDHVKVLDNDTLDLGNSDKTVEAWVNIISGDGTWRGVVSKRSDVDQTIEYELCISATYNGVCFRNSNGNILAPTSLSKGWHHIAFTTNGTTVTLYADGQNIYSATQSMVSASAFNLQIGASSEYNGGLEHFPGLIDSTRIYSRALTAAEILANYQAGNIEFQTRTSADNSTWEAWKPTTSEAALDAVDDLSPIQKISTTSLVSYWNLDETSGTRVKTAGSCTACNLTDNNTVTYAPGRLSNAGQFTAANSEYLSIADNADLSTGDIDFTLAAWVYLDSTAVNRTIVSKFNSNAQNNREYNLMFNTVNRFRFQVSSDGTATILTSVDADTFGAPSTGIWYFIVAWHDSVANTISISVNDGTPNSAAHTTGVFNGTAAFQIGVLANPAEYFDGKIDEVGFWKRTLTAAERTRLFEDGLDLHGAGSGRIYRSADTTTKLEGTGSEKLQIGSPQVDANTVGLWHLEETSGTGAYIKDSTANANHGTPTGTTVVDGFFGKARSFNGTSDYISVPDNAPLSITGTKISMGVWIKSNRNGANEQFMGKWGAGQDSYQFRRNSDSGCNSTTDQVTFRIEANGNCVLSNTQIKAGQWWHIVGTYDGTTLRIYVNGALDNSSAVTTSLTDKTSSFRLGANDDGSYFQGSLDEAFVKNVTMTADEIAEAYRAGRDHRLSRTITSTDLSAKTKLPFYVAADRPGTYLEATVGESAYANYEPDANTMGLWHLEEQTGSGAYVLDSSSNNNRGTPTGTTNVAGKIGKARSFNGTSDFINIPYSSSIDITGTSMTVEAWINPSILDSTNRRIIEKKSSAGATGYEIRINSDNTAMGWFSDGTTSCATGTSALSTNTWYHIVSVLSPTGCKLYLNGNLVSSSGTVVTLISYNDSLRIGSWDGSIQFFGGKIDEVRVSNTARTADEIRQAYEVGRRTHPVTIDFVSKPQAAYSTGTSVTINNPYGTTALTNTLSVGDTMIFKENVGGTETVSQATVNAVANTTATYGTVTLAAAPTFPSGGYTTNATVFKWQREYFDLTGSLATHRDAVTRITMRVTDGSEGRNVWLDDFRSNTNYINRLTCDTLTAATGSCAYVIPGASITSTLNRYFQVRALLSTWDTAVSPLFTGSQVEYAL